MNNKLTSFAKRHLAGIIIATLLLAVIGGGTIIVLSNHKPEPQNIGESLDYIGKKDYGCVLFWCENQPYSELYYATNLDEIGLRSYFNKAEFITSVHGTGTNYDFNMLEFKFQGQELWVTFYSSSDVLKSISAKPTTKSHIISITDSGYQLALQSL